MDVIDLAPGEVSPEDADRILLIELPNGVCGVSGSVVTAREPVHMVVPNLLPSLEEARDAGIAWAEEHDVARLYVETSGT